jgi:rhamnulokinase
MGFNFSNEGGVDRRYLVLKNIVGLWPVQQIAQEEGLGHGALVQAAAQASPWVSLIDPDDSRFLSPPSMSAAIRGFCEETGQPVPADPGSLARCVFDSLALTYRKVKGEIEAMRGRSLSLIRIVGGGSQNRLLNQLCADACQVPVLAGPSETSAIGNACVQFIALGVFRSLAEARELVRSSYPTETFNPAGGIPEEAVRRFQAFAQQPTFGGQES